MLPVETCFASIEINGRIHPQALDQVAAQHKGTHKLKLSTLDSKGYGMLFFLFGFSVTVGDD